MNSEDVVKEGNIYIRSGNLVLFQEYYQSLTIPSKLEIEIYGEEMAPPIKRLNLAYIFTKLFTNACLYNRYQIVLWLMKLYEDLDDIQKIGLKPTFNYVRHLTREKKYHKLHNYLVKLSK